MRYYHKEQLQWDGQWGPAIDSPLQFHKEQEQHLSTVHYSCSTGLSIVHHKGSCTYLCPGHLFMSCTKWMLLYTCIMNSLTKEGRKKWHVSLEVSCQPRLSLSIRCDALQTLDEKAPIKQNNQIWDTLWLKSEYHTDDLWLRKSWSDSHGHGDNDEQMSKTISW